MLFGSSVHPWWVSHQEWKERHGSTMQRHNIEKIQDAYARTRSCGVCFKLLQPSWGFVDESIARLAASALKNGCAGCLIMCNLLWPYNSDTDGASRRVSRLHDEGSLMVYGPEYLQELHVFKKSESTFSLNAVSQPKGPYISGNTNSIESFSRINSWLRNCDAEHNNCRPYNTCLPKRVVEILGPDEVQLCITENEVAPYICLSHCWGKKSIIRTTNAKIQKYQQSIPWRKLPKTFQDAISFSYRLGFSYIWIDSLCIIQDDDHDWHEQASQMSQIYTNAYLTIAATFASNSTGGCFSVPSTNTFPDPDGRDLVLHVRKHLSHASYIHNNLPLLTRGWVLQERLLSRRIIHFAEPEIFWECNTMTDCECSEIHKEVGELSHKPDFTLLLSGQHSSPHAVWQTIVMDYSRKNLTLDRDIFPALQGVAKRAQDQINVTYLAGLWERNIIGDLLWIAEPGQSRRPQEWRAPSWSWASIIGPVAYLHKYIVGENIQPLATLVRGNTTPVSDDPLGQIRAGEISLRGRYFVARRKRNLLRQADEEFIVPIFGYPGSVLYFHPDYDAQDQHGGSSKSSLEECIDGLKVLAMAIHHDDVWGVEGLCYCMVLRCVDVSTQMYERIGLATVPPSDYYHDTKPSWGKDRSWSQEEILTII